MNQLRRYVVTRFGSESWFRLAEASGVPVDSTGFDIARIYPDGQMFTLVNTASRITEIPVQEILRDFGAFIAPALLRVYEPLIDPSWKTLDVIANTEKAIHTVVRLRNPGAEPPRLAARRLSPTEVVIVYSSPRRLCDVAKGIARGLASHFAEKVVIAESECMHRGGEHCLISVKLQTQPAPVVESGLFDSSRVDHEATRPDPRERPSITRAPAKKF